MAMRKTVNVEEIVDELQRIVYDTNPRLTEHRMGICTAIEIILIEAGRYGGFHDLPGAGEGDFRRQYYYRRGRPAGPIDHDAKYPVNEVA